MTKKKKTNHNSRLVLLPKNWGGVVFLLSFIAVEFQPWDLHTFRILTVAPFIIIVYGLIRNTKGKNKPQSLWRNWLVFALLIFLSSLAIKQIDWVHDWVVFSDFFFDFLALSTIFYGMFLLLKVIRHYRRLHWILVTIPLIFIVLMSVTILLLKLIGASSTRTCQLESATVVTCTSPWNGRGDPAWWPDCKWSQNHFAGLIFVGEMFDEDCPMPPP